MPSDSIEVREDIDAKRVLPIVVGASLRSEKFDRPVAYALAERLWGPSQSVGVVPIVCTDLWYLNDTELCERAAVSIGGPDVNALSAHLASRVPSAYVIDDVLMVQFDVEAGSGHACCWGIDANTTRDAVKVFASRYAGVFIAGCSDPLV